MIKMSVVHIDIELGRKCDTRLANKLLKIGLDSWLLNQQGGKCLISRIISGDFMCIIRCITDTVIRLNSANIKICDVVICGD